MAGVRAVVANYAKGEDADDQYYAWRVDADLPQRKVLIIRVKAAVLES